jgi:hypothetical protein
MKFYFERKQFSNYFDRIIDNNLIAIYYDTSCIIFLKDGKEHNSKNVAYIADRYKHFYLNGKFYGSQFTKKSWRKFVRELKLQAFL